MFFKQYIACLKLLKKKSKMLPKPEWSKCDLLQGPNTSQNIKSSCSCGGACNHYPFLDDAGETDEDYEEYEEVCEFMTT